MRTEILLQTDTVSDSQFMQAFSELNRLAANGAIPFGFHAISFDPDPAEQAPQSRKIVRLLFPADGTKVVLASFFHALVSSCSNSIIRVLFQDEAGGGVLNFSLGDDASRTQVNDLIVQFCRVFDDDIRRELANVRHINTSPSVSDVRNLFLKVTGFGEKGVITKRPQQKGGGFALTVPHGTIACILEPSRRGWMLIEHQGEALKKVWLTAPKHVDFTVCLLLERILGDEIQPEFLYHLQEMNGNERKTFNTRIGVVKVHTRDSTMVNNAIDFVIEIVSTGEIRQYLQPKLAPLPQSFTSLSALPF